MSPPPEAQAPQAEPHDPPQQQQPPPPPPPPQQQQPLPPPPPPQEARAYRLAEGMRSPDPPQMLLTVATTPVAAPQPEQTSATRSVAPSAIYTPQQHEHIQLQQQLRQQLGPDAGLGGIQTPTGRLARKSFIISGDSDITERLYDPDRKQKPIIWEHIKLVAPGPISQPPPGQVRWRSKDAIAAYCLKCKCQFSYSKGTSKTITRHMISWHGYVPGSETATAKNKASPTAAAAGHNSARGKRKSSPGSSYVSYNKTARTAGNASVSARRSPGVTFRNEGYSMPYQNDDDNDDDGGHNAIGFGGYEDSPTIKADRRNGRSHTMPKKKYAGASSPSEDANAIMHEAHNLFFRWVVESGHSPSIVSEPGLHQAVSFLSAGRMPNKMPSPAKIWRMARTASISIREKIVELVQQATSCSLSFEVFSTVNAGNFAAVRVVTIDADTFQRRAFTLSISPVSGAVSGSAAMADDADIKLTIQPILRAIRLYQIPIHKIQLITLAGAPSDDLCTHLLAALPETSETTSATAHARQPMIVPCIVTGINNIVLGTITMGSTKPLLQKMQAIITCLVRLGSDGKARNYQQCFMAKDARRPPDLEGLGHGSDYAISTKALFVRLVQMSKLKDFETTLNSVIEKEEVRVDPNIEPLTEEEWFLFTSLAKVVQPFADALDTLSAEEYPTIGLCMLVSRRIQRLIAKMNFNDTAVFPNGFQFPNAIEKLQHIQGDMMEQFPNNLQFYLADTSSALWTMPLDPRLIGMHEISGSQRSEVKDQLAAELVRLSEDAAAESNTAQAAAKTDAAEGESASPATGLTTALDGLGTTSTMGGLFWGDSAEPTVPSAESKTKENCEKNVDRYFSNVGSYRRITDPIAWWKLNKNLFPELAQLACRWLGACTSTRAVQAMNDIPAQKKRSNLSDPHAHTWMYLNENAKLLGMIPAPRDSGTPTKSDDSGVSQPNSAGGPDARIASV